MAGHGFSNWIVVDDYLSMADHGFKDEETTLVDRCINQRDLNRIYSHLCNFGVVVYRHTYIGGSLVTRIFKQSELQDQTRED